MFTVLDCNNFWSPSGGGVRRYHLEKLEYFKNREDVNYVFVMHDNKTYSEKIGPNATIEHIKVPKVIGNWEYRYLFKRAPLEPVILKHQPDIIEVGSPYVMPSIVKSIVRQNDLKTKVFGFWHADFPVTYVGRFLKNSPFGLRKLGERLAWKYARKNYAYMAGILVASKAIMKRMGVNGIDHTFYCPLGVNQELFHPQKKDPTLIERLRAGNPNRLILFFPHRFSKEKGLHTLLKAYDILAESMSVTPALVMAGTGPLEHLAKKAVNKYDHVHFEGFIQKKEQMATYYASADLGFALSEWETFGLSLVEALSSGLPLISSGKGAAPEHIINSGAGVMLQEVSAKYLANAIMEFSQIHNPDWSIMARKYAEGFSWSQCFDNQLTIFKETLDDM